MKRTSSLLFSLALASLLGPSANLALAQDMPLSGLLVEGDGWQLAEQVPGMADGLCTDEKGNLYYSDLKSKPPGIFKIAPDGTKTKLIEEAASGLRFGPDGRIYACQGPKKQITVFELPSGKATVIATNVQPNDLVITHKGFIYITETGKKQITVVDIHGNNLRAADVGITAPNGITLSADQTTLAVSDYRGNHVWAFRIEPDGSLTAKSPYMTMRTDVDTAAKPVDTREPVYKPSCAGDGMSTDKEGRFYVTTSLGLQVFDPTGRICGVISKPGEKAMTSVGFGGKEMEYLYVACGDKIFKRKTQAHGTIFFVAPPKPAAKK